jgi:ABC-type sugar transport system ATPase subunit
VTTPLLRLDHIQKSFAGVQALKPLQLELRSGEVLGVIGENGAGKSTLINILSGVLRPDAGIIHWMGKSARFDSPHDALKAGIATIHQELAFFGSLSVAENLFMGEPWPRHFWGGLNWRRLHEEARRRLAHFDLDIPTHRALHRLSPAQKQEIAMARALSQNARLLILDEPTASLSEPEVERLFLHLQRLRQSGAALIYVSHRLEEILQLTERVAVLRDGELVAQYPTAQTAIPQLIRDMVGRPLDQIYPRSRSNQTGPVLLELDQVSRLGAFHNINFSLRSGEILGLGGLVGAGRSELARAIYGLHPIDSGRMQLRGRPWKPSGPDQSVQAGLVYIPEERKRQGLVLDHSVSDSISIGFLHQLTRWGAIPPVEETRRVNAAMAQYRVRAASASQEIGTLSGGNQQKSILARWLERSPEIILLDEPTRGVDVGAKAEIHKLMDHLAGQGKGVLLISSDLPELLGMSDRVLVLHRGSVSSVLQRENLTQENVLLAASGFPPELSLP